MAPKYFEEFSVDESHDLGSATVTEAEIVAFAEQYDPQSFHVDPAAAERGQFGALIASGWHTMAVTMRLLVDGLFADVAVVGAVGVDDLRWRKPVYGGDELHATVTVAEKEGWDDETGLIRFALETENQDGETVATRTDLVLVERGP